MRVRFLAATTVAVLTAALAAVPASAADPVLTYTPDPTWWGTNGRVVDILPVGNRVYIAGGFDYVGPTTGFGVAVNSAGTRLPSTPLIDGPVYAAVADGQGGWYVGGDFTRVGGVFRPRAAQITATGQVTGWNPRPNAPVYALAVTGSAVILGGAFTAVSGAAVPAARLAAVDRGGGALVPGWAASVNNTVRALVLSGASVYVAGDFTNVNGASRIGLVRLRAANGAVESAFAGRTNAAVKAATLSPDGTRLYVGGTFTTAWNGAAFTARSRLAAFGTSTGALLSWAPAASSTVQALATDPASGNVFAGGLFQTVGGVSRTRLAGVLPSGAVMGWNPGLNGCQLPHTTKYAHANPPCTPEVSALAVAGGALYVGGRFGQSGATVRHNAAAWSLTSGALTGWNPVASNRPLTLAPSASNLFVGGELTSVNGAVRKGVAALDARTGALDPTFNADTNDMVLDLVLGPDGSRLYLGGHFTTVRGQPRSRVASVLTTDGIPDAGFKPALNNDVLALAVGNNSLYLAGQFTTVNGTARWHLAKVSLTTGAVDTGFRADTWGPSGALRANGMVQTIQIAPDGSKVYAGGGFDSVNGAPRRGLAVLAGLTGALLPAQLGGVRSTGDCASINRLYLSPDGQRLYGGDLCPDYIYQWDAVNLSTPAKPTGLNWVTLCNAGMQGTLEVNGHFYYGTHGGNKGSGGYCWATPSGGPVAQQRFFAFDQVTGNLLPDRPEFNSPMGVWSFAATDKGLLVGGDFTFAGSAGRIQQGLALFPGTP